MTAPRRNRAFCTINRFASPFDAVSKDDKSVFDFNRQRISFRTLLTVVLKVKVDWPNSKAGTIGIKCPFHNGQHKDSLKINLATGFCSCFSECNEWLKGADVSKVYWFANRDRFRTVTQAAKHLALEVIPNLPEEHIEIESSSLVHTQRTSHSLIELTKQTANPEKIRKLWNSKSLYHYKMLDLLEMSPVSLDARKQGCIANEIVPVLMYERKELWRLGEYVGDWNHVGTPAELRRQINGFTEYQFWCPSLMRKRETGEAMKARNVKERIYLCLEWDEECSKDYQTTIIVHLAELWEMPLVVVTDSRKDSLHACWHVRGMDEEKLRDMMEYAIELGADKAMWEPRQWSRLPGGWRRDMGKRQVVLYFNPDFV